MLSWPESLNDSGLELDIKGKTREDSTFLCEKLSSKLNVLPYDLFLQNIKRPADGDNILETDLKQICTYT